MTVAFGAARGAVFKPKPAAFFASPEPAGRKIVCGFSYIQRIGKSATTEVWFPQSLQEKIATRVLAGDETVLDELHVEWAAVRQFELLQESDNFYIYDMKVEHFTRAYEDIMKMRARGYRITVITMGHYVEPLHYDELRILDARLQDEITQLIRILYLEAQSLAESREQGETLRKGDWNFAQALPHVAMTLGAADLFMRGVEVEDEEDEEEKGGKSKSGSGDQRSAKAAQQARQQRLSQHFFRILQMLSQKHVSHDVAVGLALPEVLNRQTMIYCAPAEYQYHAFQTALATVFRSFDHISLSTLHERPDARAEIMPTMRHMRGYGDRNPVQEAQNRESAAFLQQAGSIGRRPSSCCL